MARMDNTLDKFFCSPFFSSSPPTTISVSLGFELLEETEEATQEQVSRQKKDRKGFWLRKDHKDEGMMKNLEKEVERVKEENRRMRAVISECNRCWGQCEEGRQFDLNARNNSQFPLIDQSPPKSLKNSKTDFLEFQQIHFFHDQSISELSHELQAQYSSHALVFLSTLLLAQASQNNKNSAYEHGQRERTVYEIRERDFERLQMEMGVGKKKKDGAWRHSLRRKGVGVKEYAFQGSE